MDLSDEFKELINSMISYNPDERPCIIDLINYPWMKLIYYHKETKSKLLKLITSKK